MQIKAQGLLNAAKWVEAEYGRDALGEVVRACSPEVRDRYISGIAINWHPVEEFLEFVETADRLLGRGGAHFAEEIGAAGARANMKGALVRVAFYLAQPEFFFRRVTSLWSQFNDEGEMLVNSLEERASSVELSGLKNPRATFCAVLTGWIRQVAVSLGVQKPAVRHVECRARGDARCLWEVRWAAIEGDESDRKRASGGPDSAGNLLAAPRRFPSSGALPATSPASTRPSGSGRPPSSGGMSTAPGRFPSSGTLPATSPATGRPPSSGKVPSSSERTPSSLPRKLPPPKGESSNNGNK